MKRLLAGIEFLKIVPLPAICRHTEKDLVRSVPFFPLVGLLIGLPAAGISIIFDGFFPPMVISVFITAWLVVAHGGLHLDGIGDTADGFFSHNSLDRVMEIMRDNSIGAFGCVAIMGILAFKIAAIGSMSCEHRTMAVLLAPIAGRCVMVPMLSFLPSARPDGLGHLLSQGRSVFESFWVLFFFLAASWIAARFAGLIAAAAVIITTVLFACFCMLRIKGTTGDTIGASSEIAETVILLVLSIQPISCLW